MLKYKYYLLIALAIVVGFFLIKRGVVKLPKFLTGLFSKGKGEEKTLEEEAAEIENNGSETNSLSLIRTATNLGE